MEAPTEVKTKTMTAKLQSRSGNQSFDIGEIRLLETDPVDRFAQVAFRTIAGSAKRLMPQDWQIVVRDENGVNSTFPLTKWVKLVDGDQVAQKKHEKFLRNASATRS